MGFYANGGSDLATKNGAFIIFNQQKYEVFYEQSLPPITTTPSK